ncbi:MAG TPA: adenylate/guanylate cyclase domain-containing protein [Geminicoccaceae bacterium]|nr:adenylate/guanylate cyclase domain-containing protein [Geminicoccaceae bacterium]
MEDIAGWLEQLGLGRYAAVFAANDVDREVLAELTEADLEKLGVSLGHRKKLLKAIAAGEAAAAAPPVAVAAPPPEAERRQLTVMFVDLVGSTALSARLDPEEMGEVLRRYHDAVTTEISRFDGHVANLMGDGVLAYFGWPRAHEDEAERAVRAALGIVVTVAALATPAGRPLMARIGIATGPVVVGSLAGAAQEQAVVGETPNLAARLQALAEPSGIVVSPRTRKLVEGLFELGDLGEHELKGFAAPVRAWRVVGLGRNESRFEARHAKGLTPLVGREHELGLLLDRWQQAREGEGQVVLLSGEAGIGKSRLVRALRERLAAEPCTPLSHFCSPFHQTSALQPVIELLERTAGLARDEPPEQSLGKLEALLARGTAEVAVAAPLIASLLSIPTGGRYPVSNLTPQRQKEETFAALLAQLTGLAAKEPVLVVYEDVHWADPSTLELVDRMIERVQRLPVLVLVTFRPEFVPPWHRRAHVSSLALSRLSRSRGSAMVAELTRGKPLPAEVADQILARTDGVPLFVEELTKAVLESGQLTETAGQWALAGPQAPLAIPATLRDSLMARLDRLGPVKEVAQVAACIGREFDYELLAAVAPLDGAALRDALQRLTDVELVFGQGAEPYRSYVFKHALVRDAAYDSLLRTRRQQLHARITAAIEGSFPEVAETRPELLARHCTEAGLTEQAVDYWQRAGQQALAHAAMAEALEQLGRGLELLDGLSPGPEHRRRELGLQLALGQASTAARGFAAPETGRAYGRAHSLCLELGDVPELFPILYGESVFHLQRGAPGTAHELARELLRLAEERGDGAARVIGHRMVGSALCQLGRPVASRDHFQAALTLYDPVRDRTSALVYAIDSRVMCLSWLSHVLTILGQPEEAEAAARDVPGHADELAHPVTSVVALAWGCMFRQLRREREDARAQADAAVALAAEQGFPLYRAAGTVVRGWTLVEGGALAEGVAEIRDGLAGYAATGAELWSPYFLGLLAAALGRAGEAAGGLEAVADALGRVERTGARWFEAELHRLGGELSLLLAAPDPAGAEAGFRRALGVARGQGARLWALRAATRLARLWLARGRHSEARDLLAPIHNRFSEGFNLPDLVEARALLDALG